LTVNAVIVAVTFMGYALFRTGKQHWVIYAVLLTGGFFRSLQFTSLNGVAFADVDHAQMSRASTMSTMGQQLSQTMGIGIAPAFIAVGCVALIPVLFFIPLPADAGEGLHGAPAGPRRRDRFFRHA
jgi:hypothetical protein